MTIHRLTDGPLAQGLMAGSERVYELLALGTNLPQSIAGDTRPFTLGYVDWQHADRSAYHVSDEFSV